MHAAIVLSNESLIDPAIWTGANWRLLYVQVRMYAYSDWGAPIGDAARSPSANEIIRKLANSITCTNQWSVIKPSILQSVHLYPFMKIDTSIDFKNSYELPLVKRTFCNTLAISYTCMSISMAAILAPEA